MGRILGFRSLNFLIRFPKSVLLKSLSCLGIFFPPCGLCFPFFKFHTEQEKCNGDVSSRLLWGLNKMAHMKAPGKLRCNIHVRYCCFFFPLGIACWGVVILSDPKGKAFRVDWEYHQWICHLLPMPPAPPGYQNKRGIYGYSGQTNGHWETSVLRILQYWKKEEMINQVGKWTKLLF